VLLGSLAILLWFVVFVCLNALYIPLIEEYILEQRFGDAYGEYKRNVPRWIPRLHAWQPQKGGKDR
jgi:protein-S-isoprenylcysteine O-methyltransferase Ste14